MKVLMVSDVFFPRVNGVSTSIDTFRQKLPDEGVTVDVLAPAYGPTDAAEAGILRVPSRPVPRDPEDRLMSWRAAWQRWPELARAGYQAIHIQTPFMAHYVGVRLARRLRVPVIATYHTLFEEYLHHYLPWVPRAWLAALARGVSRWQCNGLHGVVVPSTAMAQRLREYGIRAPLTILPTGIPIARFAQGDRARFRAAHGIPEDRPVALFVGRVAFEKNISFLLESMLTLRQSCPTALLLITGEGPARAALEKQAAALGLSENVLFLGYLDRNQGLADAYAAADVFTFASRTETQGLVLLEAMAAGLPVVALAEMGTRDILGPERGCRIAPDNPAAFAHIVAAVLNDPSLRTALQADARAYALEWSDAALAQRLASLYRSL